MAKTVKRAYRYRFYPTPEQADLLSRTFGCVRYVYNRALAERSRAWTQDRKRVTFAQTCRMLTEWKAEPERAWLSQGAEPSTVTVSRDAAGRWFVSILVEETIEQHPAVDTAVGIDAGITSLLTLSTGEKIANPWHERRDRARLARAQRALSRKQKGSANREKARRKVARIHARIADRRADFLHKVTTRLVRENQALAIEDLSVRNMVKNHSLARAISDASWSQFRRMLEYKADWHGRTVIAVDRFYPSSKTCSACGALAAKMPLSVREWECASCGTVHDRDVNAAKVLVAAGLAVAACGDGVRPSRA
jgi:putative transposase